MLSRLRSRLNPATVIATMALFAALGGGYATAFSGSGTVQKGARVGFLVDEGPVVVRSLTGIGSIQAQCHGEPDVNVYFQNDSGETLNVEVMGAQQDIDLGPINTVPSPGHSPQINDQGAGDGIDDTMFVHVSPVDGTKTPQADIQVTAVGVDNCSTARVSVLATNTQE